MTSSSDSFPKRPKVLIIHGMNNHPYGWQPLMHELKNRNIEVIYMSLPSSILNKDFNENLTSFNEQMFKEAHGEYFVIAFSQGALYLQLWLQEFSPKELPRGQILLAPAFCIKKLKSIKLMTKILPQSMPILSLAPPKLRERPWLTVRDYGLLLEGLNRLKTPLLLLCPSLILVDPKDELINAEGLKSIRGKAQIQIEYKQIERPSLKRPGSHHILFHPEYFESELWKNFLQDILTFIRSC